MPERLPRMQAAPPTAGYLRDVLSRLPAMTNQDDLAPLTPARWPPSVEVVATTWPASYW
ncbi:MAG: hypothetical protein WC661_03535 [Opitutaceae bacterium]